MANCASSVASSASSSPAPAGAGRNRPARAKSSRAAAKLGAVVHAMWRIWAKSSVPATAGARFVVSDSGDILSPK